MTTALYIGFEVILIAVITFMAVMMPAVSRPGLSFGAEIPKEYSKHEGIIKLRESYQRYCMIGGGVLLALTLILHATVSSLVADLFLPFAMISYLLFTTFCHYSAYKKTLKLKKELGWDKQVSGKVVVDTAPNGLQLPSAWWFTVHIVMIVATAALLWVTYPSMPGMIPMHMDITGNVTRYAEKSIKVILLPLMTQCYITLVCFLAFLSIKYAKRQLDPKDAVASSKRNTIFRTVWLYYVLLLSLLMNVLMIIIGQVMYITPQLMPSLPYVLTGFVVVILASSIVISVKFGQGGSKIKIDGKTADGLIQSGSDQYWKAGMFYYNPDDPAIFVEKRFGIGWTFNFARPIAWLYMAALAVIILVFTVGTMMIAG